MNSAVRTPASVPSTAASISLLPYSENVSRLLHVYKAKKKLETPILGKLFAIQIVFSPKPVPKVTGSNHKGLCIVRSPFFLFFCIHPLGGRGDYFLFFF